MSIPIDAQQRRLLDVARRATLATIDPDGRPRLVPCCFALVDDSSGATIFTPIDDKPKASTDARSLARVRDIERDPRVTILVDTWDEDWAHLEWIRIDGVARLLWSAQDPGDHGMALRALRARYPQYADHALKTRPVIAIRPVAVHRWGGSTTSD